MLNQNEVIERLRQEAKKLGSQRALAIHYDIGQAYVSDVLSGRREPGKKILDALGLERVVGYREKQG